MINSSSSLSTPLFSEYTHLLKNAPFRGRDRLLLSSLLEHLSNIIPAYMLKLSDVELMTDQSRIKELDVLETGIGKVVADLDLPTATCNTQYRALLDKMMSPFFMLLMLEVLYQNLTFITEKGCDKDVLAEHYECVLSDLDRLKWLLGLELNGNTAPILKNSASKPSSGSGSGSSSSSSSIGHNNSNSGLRDPVDLVKVNSLPITNRRKSRRASSKTEDTLAAAAAAAAATATGSTINDSRKCLELLQILLNELSMIVGMRLSMVETIIDLTCTTRAQLVQAHATLIRVQKEAPRPGTVSDCLKSLLENTTMEIDILFSLVNAHLSVYDLRFVDCSLSVNKAHCLLEQVNGLF